MVYYLIVFFLVSILFSFLCSILEAVLLSITPSYINRAVQEGTRTGKLLEEYKKDIDKPLSAILTLNTVAHTVGAIGVGAFAAQIWGENSLDFSLFGLAVHLPITGIVAGVMTLLILVLSEIIPKTIGANNWRSLTPFTAVTLKWLIFLLYPLVRLSQLITGMLKKDKSKSVLSRADFAAMANIVGESGELAANESAIIKNLLSFESQTIRDIMTPRTVAFMADESTLQENFHKQHHPIRFSRIPIYSESTDNITGIILKDELQASIMDGNGSQPLVNLKREVNFVPDNMPLPKLFDAIVKERNHLQVVVDDFGSVVGLVSLEDIFETLLGKEIVDEFDAVTDMQRLAKQKWETRQKN